MSAAEKLSVAAETENILIVFDPLQKEKIIPKSEFLTNQSFLKLVRITLGLAIPRGSVQSESL